MAVQPITARQATEVVVEHHYLHRRPPISAAFGLFDRGGLVGAVTFGVPASRHLQKSACPEDPQAVIELNRLWVLDEMPRNTESWFVSRALKQLPARIVVSYADTTYGHVGYVYRALGWNYAGWTDMERKTARLDYIPLDPQAHTREAFRSGYSEVRYRKPKAKYWTTTGNPTDRRVLRQRCGWPVLSWDDYPVPMEHKQIRLKERESCG